MDEAALIQYYVDLLIYQFRGKPNARGTIAILVKQLIADGLLRNIEDAFWLDSAIGEQLDTIGKYVGLPRNIGPSADKDYFGFHNYVFGQPDNDNGFRDYTDPTVNAAGEWYSYLTKTLLKTEVSDSVYAPMIRLKAALNTWDGTLVGANEILRRFLSGSYSGVREISAHNLAYNPAFAFGLDGWAADDIDTGFAPTLALATGAWALLGGATAVASIPGTPASGKVWTLSSSRNISGLTIGATMAFSAYAQSDGASLIGLELAFVNSLGAEIAPVARVQAVPNASTQGQYLSDYLLLIGEAIVPEGAVFGVLRLTATADGSATPWLSTALVDVREGRAVPAPFGAIFETTGDCANQCHTIPAVSGTTGWHQTYNNTGLTVTMSAEAAPDGLLNFGTLRASVTGTPAADKQWTLTTLPDEFAVIPGQRIDASAYVQGVGLRQADLVVVYRAGGAYFAEEKLVVFSIAGDATDSASLTGYSRVAGISEVPAGAETAFLQVTAISNGDANPWIGVAKPVIQIATAAQTENAPWAPGLESLGGDEATWYIVEADLGIDPTTFVGYLPRKVGTSIRLTYSKPGLASTDYTAP